jgi:transitional endoplasmic reticulum ATPase
MPLGKDVDIDGLAGMSEGYVGADIEAVCREAAMLALRENFENDKVHMIHFTKALEKVKPTINEDINDFYNRLFRKLRGGTHRAESSSYTGYI